MPFVIKAENREPRPEPIPLTAAEREIQKAIKTSTGDLQSAVGTNAVGKAITARNIERVVEAFPWDATAQTINATAATFGQVVTDNIGKGFPKVGFASRFDFTDPRSTAFAQAQAAQLVTAVSDSTRKIIRETIADAFNNGVTVKETARRLRSVIGLNERQTVSMRKFQDGLTSRVASKELTIGQAEKMLERQYKKMINYRADLIARQEIIMAENNGRYLGFQQSVEQGWADPKSVKRWSTSTDERTCDICLPMNGKSVQWNQSYPNGVFNPPAHILCRCTISLLEPDSSLAQSFMPPSKPAPSIMDLPMPALPTLPFANLRTPEDALVTAQTNASGTSTFQYDAGQIENLNVVVDNVIFNGSPYTELRFKLTSGAKTRLRNTAEKSIAKDDGKWLRDSGTLLIDKKIKKQITFVELDDNMRYGRVGAYINTDGSSNTYTAYRPNGTAIRFVTSRDAYAFDGQVRVMIPGKATPKQIQDAMKELGLTANRLPSAEDVEKLKTAKLISLFNPRFGNTLEKAQSEIDAEVGKIMKRYKFNLNEIETEIDADGALRFLLPESVAKELMEETGIKSIKHGLGGLLYNVPEEERVERIASFFLGNKLRSQTQRKLRGDIGEGISEGSDVRTGGADYVFVRPSIKGLEEASEYQHTIIFKPEALLRRMDYYGYAEDSYGVKNPLLFRQYLRTKDGTNTELPNTFDEIFNPTNSTEMMFQHSIDMKDIWTISTNPYDRDLVITKLKGLGITEWQGRKIEDVIILGKEFGK